MRSGSKEGRKRAEITAYCAPVQPSKALQILKFWRMRGQIKQSLNFYCLICTGMQYFYCTVTYFRISFSLAVLAIGNTHCRASALILKRIYFPIVRSPDLATRASHLRPVHSLFLTSDRQSRPAKPHPCCVLSVFEPFSHFRLAHQIQCNRLSAKKISRSE